MCAHRYELGWRPALPIRIRTPPRVAPSGLGEKKASKPDTSHRHTVPLLVFDFAVGKLRALSVCLAGLTLVRPRIYPSVRYNKVQIFVCEPVGVSSTSNVGMQSTALGYQFQIESCLETEEVIS